MNGGRFIVGLLLAGATMAQADFTWLNKSTNRVAYASGSPNFLAGSSNDPSAGCFVQLIYAGTNNVNDPASDTNTGVTVDDVVVSNLWIGARAGGSNGVVNGDLLNGGVTNGYYFVRLWTAPSGNFPLGLVPASPTNFYVDSVLHKNDTFAPSLPDDFIFAGTGLVTTLKARFTDSDADDLPDWWEVEHYGSVTTVVASSDSDGDGTGSQAEYIAGTQPTNSASVFEVVSTGTDAGGVVIRWNSAAEKRYQVERAVTLTGTYSTLASNLAALLPENTYTDAVAGSTSYFYRVRVRGY